MVINVICVNPPRSANTTLKLKNVTPAQIKARETIEKDKLHANISADFYGQLRLSLFMGDY